MNIVVAAIFTFMLLACGPNEGLADVNRPLAQADVSAKLTAKQVNRLVNEFSRRNHFAVQPLVSQPRGLVQFSIRLFRDDISIVVTQLQDGPIQVMAYPLCACELNRRVGLQAAANEAVDELKRKLAGG
jgi:hypothetical protein